MRRLSFFLLLLFYLCKTAVAQQAPLPVIAVKNINNQIIISWVNDYRQPVVTLNIQRSYDSIKNYSTIGTVLSPQSRENGYVDPNPPYNKMYYRLFVAYEGGDYVLSQVARPVKDTSSAGAPENYPWMATADDPGKAFISVPPPVEIVKDSVSFPPAKPGITYPSMRIFTARDNNIVIHLPDAATKKYTAKFFDENEKLLFELTKLKEEYLIVEKVNFVRPGWFRFEVYEDGELIENNRFQIVKDVKKL